MDKQQLENLLSLSFPKKHITAALDHFSGLVSKFQAGEWEPCTGKAGKFIEATLKALFAHVGQTPPKGRKFKADPIINYLGQLADGSFDDTIRLTIPRACRFVYDIASNRGARHDPDEVDSNEMDASVIVPTCSWILAEMIRYSQKGAVNLQQAKEIVESLSTRRYPLIEDVDGRVYFHIKKKTAPDIALLTLAHHFPGRVSKQDLVEAIKRHGFTDSNSRMAVKGIMRLVDNDRSDNLRLLTPGLKRAEEIKKEKAQ